MMMSLYLMMKEIKGWSEGLRTGAGLEGCPWGEGSRWKWEVGGECGWWKKWCLCVPRWRKGSKRDRGILGNSLLGTICSLKSTPHRSSILKRSWLKQKLLDVFIYSHDSNNDWDLLPAKSCFVNFLCFFFFFFFFFFWFIYKCKCFLFLLV